ncbi:transcription factor TFIIIB component B'' homolog [Trichogramma pretiosum]|uniref:transcription factor TFIIIB component B'' homolog n=1 Tax=Trichogramma pretiosum TaxID=7493 RepID=UPI0006C988B0|nr:transcription factor TFIIIB component B'' homolog [Trichogramma pretiosum]
MNGRMRFAKPPPRLDAGRVRRNSVAVAPVVPTPPPAVVNGANSASESEEEIKRPPTPSSPVKSIPPLSPHRSAPSPHRASVSPQRAILSPHRAPLSPRARSESVCSTQSHNEITSSPVVNNNPSKLNVAPKKRTALSETAKKLADSRKEFMQKKSDITHDKGKLKMLDLIYYNPKGDPMTSKPTTNRTARTTSVCSAISESDSVQDEEPRALGPQIKLGPDGQMMIDQESLVANKLLDIENMEIIEDEEPTGGFYKRRSKSKDWNKWATIKFYKALSTYGTDFSLMKDVFPDRKRIELKLKYKKELKENPELVEKALEYQIFEPDLLKEAFEEIDNSQKKELEKLKMKKDNEEAQKRKRKRCVMVRDCIDQANGSVKDSEANDNKSDENSDGSRITITDKKRKKPVRGKKKVVCKRRRTIESSGPSENEDDSNQNKKENEGKKNKNEKKNEDITDQNEVENNDESIQNEKKKDDESSENGVENKEESSQNRKENEDFSEKQENTSKDKESQIEKESEDNIVKES